MEIIKGGPGDAVWWDKVPSKFDGWSANEFEQRGFPRRARTAIVAVRPSCAKGVVLMPSFVNLGAYVDEGTMVDGWATVGSCAQIGKNVHLSGGVGIGGVLEPMQAGPDHYRGQLLHRRALGGGRGLHRARGFGARHGRLHRQVDQDRQPRDRRDQLWRSAALFGGGRRHDAELGQADGQRRAPPHLYCAVIVKTVDEQTRSKTGINELLRD
jgi:2,3,4,5-tetrahydropyridine-2-carboxylate N-succinyltransferase